MKMILFEYLKLAAFQEFSPSTISDYASLTVHWLPRLLRDHPCAGGNVYFSVTLWSPR